MPSTISSTTAGTRSRGASDTSSGAASAIAATASREPYELGITTVYQTAVDGVETASAVGGAADRH